MVAIEVDAKATIRRVRKVDRSCIFYERGGGRGGGRLVAMNHQEYPQWRGRGMLTKK